MSVSVYQKPKLRINVNEAIRKIAQDPESRLNEVLCDLDIVVENGVITSNVECARDVLGLTPKLTLEPDLLMEVEKFVNSDKIVLIDRFHPISPGDNLIGFYVWQIAESCFKWVGSILEDLDSVYGLVIIPPNSEVLVI